ncbi:hypothetical protein BGZ58_008720, partial [Dissophora ornata]
SLAVIRDKVLEQAEEIAMRGAMANSSTTTNPWTTKDFEVDGDVIKDDAEAKRYMASTTEGHFALY